MSVMTAQPIPGRVAWRGEDLAASSDWIRMVTTAEVDELDRALRAVQRRGLAWRDVTGRTSDPAVLPVLAEVRAELEDGRGLVLLRRIPVERYNEDELRILYWGIGLHLGTPRYQNPRAS